MLRLRLLLSLLTTACLLSGALGHAQENSACPWLTLGSAAQALHGDARVAVLLKDKSQGVCTFSKLAPPRSELTIFVGGDAPSCPKDSEAVNAIGTRASQCSLHTPRRHARRMISGVVREKSFAVVITNEAADSLKQTAEMVAGSLF